MQHRGVTGNGWGGLKNEPAGLEIEPRCQLGSVGVAGRPATSGLGEGNLLPALRRAPVIQADDVPRGAPLLTARRYPFFSAAGV
jgi:hypothetical protein